MVQRVLSGRMSSSGTILSERTKGGSHKRATQGHFLNMAIPLNQGMGGSFGWRGIYAHLPRSGIRPGRLETVQFLTRYFLGS
jgi:hypothetical protein